MKKYSVLSLLLIFACQPQETVTFSEEDANTVKEASAQYGAAIIAGDLDRIAALVDAEVALMPPNMQAVKGPDATLDFMGEGPDIDGSITPDEVIGSGDLAYVQGKYALTFMINDSTQSSDNGKYIEVWKKQADGSWKVVKDIWNSNVALEGEEM